MTPEDQALVDVEIARALGLTVERANIGDAWLVLTPSGVQVICATVKPPLRWLPPYLPEARAAYAAAARDAAMAELGTLAPALAQIEAGDPAGAALMLTARIKKILPAT